MSMPFEVDWACLKTLPQLLRLRWYRSPPPNYNYVRYLSAILNFSAKEASDEVGIPVKNVPQKLLGIAIEIASISVSFAKLLVLPVWGTVSTSGLYMMVFAIGGRCRGR